MAQDENRATKQRERIEEQDKMIADMEYKLTQTIKEFQKIHTDYIKSIEQQNINILKEKRALEIMKQQQKLLEGYKKLEDHLY